MGVIVVQRRAVRIGQRDRDLVIKGLQPQPDPGNCPAGPRRAGEAIDPAFELRPDFSCGAFDMRLAVGAVVKLVGPDRAGRFLCQAARGMDEMPRIGKRRGRHQHQLRPQRAQGVHFFPALGFGHHDDRLIAQRVGDQGQPDPGIPGGALHNRPARQQRAARLGIAHDPQRRAVLDRGTGVGKFALAPDFAASGLAGALEQHQRRIADQRQGITGDRQCVHARRNRQRRRSMQCRMAWPR